MDFGATQVWFPIKDSPYISNVPLTSYPSDPQIPQILHVQNDEHVYLSVFLTIKITPGIQPSFYT